MKLVHKSILLMLIASYQLVVDNPVQVFIVSHSTM